MENQYKEFVEDTGQQLRFISWKRNKKLNSQNKPFTNRSKE